MTVWKKCLIGALRQTFFVYEETVKRADFLQSGCYENFDNIHRKTFIAKPSFNEVCKQKCFHVDFANILKACFTEHFRTTVLKYECFK